MLVQINQHQDQETLDRSRISTWARPPEAWVTECTTRHRLSQLTMAVTDSYLLLWWPRKFIILDLSEVRAGVESQLSSTRRMPICFWPGVKIRDLVDYDADTTSISPLSSLGIWASELRFTGTEWCLRVAGKKVLRAKSIQSDDFIDIF